MRLSKRRFAYVTIESDGSETLRLGRIDYPMLLSPFAIELEQLDTQPGPSGQMGGIPEIFGRIAPSPNMRRLVSHSVQSGKGFVDHNILILDLVDGDHAIRFNEHRFAGLDRTNWHSYIFAEYLAAEAAAGVPAASLAKYQWEIGLEGILGANVAAPTFHWLDDDTLVINWQFELTMKGGGYSYGLEHFLFLYTAKDNFESFSQYKGRLPSSPVSTVSVAPDTGFVQYNGKDLPFRVNGAAWPWPGFFKSVKRKARIAIGYVA